MTSIIKVDTLQTAAGGVPTAADLGLNVTGSVLQVVHGKDTGTIANSSSDLIYASATSITPKSATSKITITFSFYADMAAHSSGWSLGDFAIYDSHIAGLINHAEYEGGVRVAELRYNGTRQAIVDSVGTSPRTFSLGFRKHGGVYASYVNLGRRSVIITEIAG